MKKILVILVFVIMFTISVNAYNLTENEKQSINQLISIFNGRIKNNGEVYKDLLVKGLNARLNEYEKGERNYEILYTVLNGLTKDMGKIEQQKLNNNISNLVVYNGISNEEIDKLLLENRSIISQNDNIFVFRTTNNISLDTMIYLSKRIYELNSHIRIFVDQEGGLVNRYNIFDTKYSFDGYLSEDVVLNSKFELLEEDTKNLIVDAVKNRTTFFSTKKAGEIYSKLENSEEKNKYLDFISYFELFVIAKAGINTYGLVLDLDMGNPAITGNERSFSKNVDDYILYGNYFVKNAKDLGISLYLKHYPGHGAGKVDTHSGVLEYSVTDKEYIENNLWVFESVVKTAKDINSNVGLMVGHIIMPIEYKNRFLGNLGEVNFILTDDLGMNAYKIAKDKNYTDKFFTTDEVIKYGNVIQVSTTINQIK